jgi:hypothetical protein
MSRGLDLESAADLLAMLDRDLRRAEHNTTDEQTAHEINRVRDIASVLAGRIASWGQSKQIHEKERQ